MSFGGSQNQIRYSLILDDQATAKIGTYKTALTSLNTTTQQSTNFTKQLGAGLGPLANNYANASGAAKDMIVQQTKVGSTVTQNISKFSTFAIGLSATTSGALQLAAGFRDYNDAQIAVDRTQRRVSLATEALHKAQDKLISLTNSGIKSGKQYEQAQLDVKQAQDQLSIQTQLLGESQERMFDSQTQFAASVIPTVLGAIGTLGAAFKDLGLKGDKLKSMFSSIGGSVTGLKGNLLGIGLAAGGIALVTEGAIAMANGINKAVMSFDKLAKPVAVLEALTDKSGKRLQDFNQNLKETELLTKAGVTPAMFILDQIMGTHLVQDTLKNAGALDKYNQIIRDSTKWTTELGYSFKQIHGPVATSQADLDKLAGTIQPLGENLAWATGKLIEFNLQWGIAHGKIPLGAADIETATKNLNNNVQTAQTWINQNLAKKLTDTHDALLAQAAAAGASDKELAGMTSTTGKLNPQLETENKRLTDIINRHGELTPEQQKTVDLAKQQQAEFQKVTDAIQKQQDAVQKTRDAWKKFSEEFSKATELKGAFGIKVDENKFLKEIKKALPDKLAHKLKLDLKIEEKTDIVKKGIQDFIKGVLEPGNLGQFVWDPNLKVDDKTAQKYGKAIIKAIDDFFGGHKNVPQQFKSLETAIENAVGNKKTAKGGADKLLAILKAKIEGTEPFKIPVAATLTAEHINFLKSGKSRFSNTVGGNKILALLGLEPMDLQITIPAPKIPAPVTTDFDTGIAEVQTTLNTTKMILPAIDQASKFQRSLFLAIANSKQTVTLIDSALKKVSGITIPAADQAKKYQKGLQLAIDNAAQTVDLIGKELKQVSKIKVPGPNLSGFEKALDQMVKKAKSAVQAVDSALSKGKSKPESAAHASQPKRQAQSGMHEFLSEDTLIQAHRGERVDIGHITPSFRSSGGGGGDINIELTNVLFDERIMRKFTARQGRNRYSFG